MAQDLASRDEYSRQLIATVVTEVFDIFDKERKEHGDEFFFKLHERMIGALIGTLLYKTLSEVPSTTLSEKGATRVNPQDAKNRQLQARQNIYKALKALIEGSVVSGFAGGILSLEPEAEVEFVCQVIKVTQPSNKVSA